MAFHEVRFPAPVSLGSLGGPERRTDIVALASGHEERNSPWADSRRRYDAATGVQSADDLHEVVAFFEARRGMLYGFRWRDWLDHKSCPPEQQITPLDQEIGVGDGAETSFQLVKRYASGGESWLRRIAKPVAGSVRVAVGGVEIFEGSGFTLDETTGVVSLASAPTAGAVVTAGFEFDVPVRFDTDRIDVSASALAAGEIPSIPVVELRL